jgi:glycosyltransferase involved in cell wall biosynthesis
MSQVSCIIPYYNGGDSIAQAIESVIDNAFCKEVVVVVDGSPQPLEPYLNSRQAELAASGKLRIVKLATNLGQGSARNIGVAVSTAELISFLDQDDIYLPDFYDNTVPFLDATPQVAAVEVGAEFYQNGQSVLDERDPRYRPTINSVPWNVIVRRDVFWRSGAFPVGGEFRSELAGEDIAFKKALVFCFQVAKTETKLIRHHVREGAATDRYLKRTVIVDGQVKFKDLHAHEEDSSFAMAVERHIERTRKELQRERQ